MSYSENRKTPMLMHVQQIPHKDTLFCLIEDMEGRNKGGVTIIDCAPLPVFYFEQLFFYEHFENA